MTERLTFVPATRAVIEAISPVDGVTVFSRPQNPRPSEQVVIRRVGGTARDLVTDAPLFTVEAWAQDDERAERLCNLARFALHSLPRSSSLGVPFYTVVEIAGPAFLPDPETDLPRYSCTVQVALRGAE